MSTKRKEHSEQFPTLSRAASSVALQDTAAQRDRPAEVSKRGGGEPEHQAAANLGTPPLSSQTVTACRPALRHRPARDPSPAPGELPSRRHRPLRVQNGGGRRAALGTQRLSSPASGFRPRRGADKPHAWTLTFPYLLA